MYVSTKVDYILEWAVVITISNTTRIETSHLFLDSDSACTIEKEGVV